MTQQQINLLTRADLARRGITYSNVTLLEQENLGLFPKRLRISQQRVAWVEHEVDSYLEAKIAERDGGSNA